MINESLRHQISVTLHSCYLNQKRQEAEEHLREVLKELEIHNRQLKRESVLDELTGLLNRRGFTNLVQDVLNKKKKKHLQYSLFFADMDGLKKINDTYGHAEGDRAIKDMSEILKVLFRQEDVLARLGGDEFTMFALNVPDNFQEIIDRRLETVLTQFLSSRTRPYRLSISIGSVQGFTDETPLLQERMKEADEKLYIVKKVKKGQSVPSG